MTKADAANPCRLETLKMERIGLLEGFSEKEENGRCEAVLERRDKPKYTEAERELELAILPIGKVRMDLEEIVLESISKYLTPNWSS